MDAWPLNIVQSWYGRTLAPPTHETPTREGASTSPPRETRHGLWSKLIISRRGGSVFKF